MATSTYHRSALELPDELFGLIVTKLPLLYIFKLRLVCKHWNATLHNTRFLKMDFQLTSRAPFYVCRTLEGFAAYSPEMNSWHMWPKSFILPEDAEYEVSGAARGLLLVQKTVGWTGASYLVNPMTRSHKRLSELQKVWPMGMVFNNSSNSYKIIGVYDGQVLVTVLRCGDATSTYKWYPYLSSLSTVNNNGGGGVMRFDLPTFHRGILHYLITKYPNRLGGQIHGICCCDDTMSWRQLRAAQMPCGLLFSHAFVWQEKFMLVGGKDEGHCVSTVGVWQLDEERNVWMKSTNMPDTLLHRFSPLEPRLRLKFWCVSDADYVYFTSYTRDYLHVRHVICNLSNTSWRELPELLSAYEPTRIGFGSFLFQPRFDEI